MSGRKPKFGSRFVGPGGMGVLFVVNDAGVAFGHITLQPQYEGPAGYAHGGVLAALIDEAMGAAAWHSGDPVVAANLNFDYRLPVPLHTPLTISGRVERREGRKVFTLGDITLPNARLAVEGRGLWLNATFAARRDH